MKNVIKRLSLVLSCALVLAHGIMPMCSYAYASGSDASRSDELAPFWSALLIGAVFALIIVLVMKSGMKRTNGTGTAGEYLDRESVDISYSNDRFMYSTLTKVKKPENNNNKR